MLSEEQAVAQAKELKRIKEGERQHLDLIRRYWKGVQRLPAVISTSDPREVRTMARIARVNVCKIIIDSVAQSLFVDNFQGKDDEADLAVWNVWQKNKFDARQSGIHRAAAAYGAAYAIVLPGEFDGEAMPVIRGVSPRHLTAVYTDDPDWPDFALEYRGAKSWRLYDNEGVYVFTGNNRGSEFTFVESYTHDAGVTPVVRYLDEDDLDSDDDVQVDQTTPMDTTKPMRGQVAPVMPLQDQIDLTSFSLLVAQWFSAFRQRYAIGWVPDSDEEKMKAAASRLWTFDQDPTELKLGEFDQTNLDGYIKSREASIRHAATLSQTPVHELIGELVNLSAEALAAAEAGRDRKIDERKTILGEAHEQMLRLAAKLAKQDVPDGAQVVWRDTSARTFAATVDGLGKLVTMLGVPPEMLWEQIPGITKQDVQRWKAAAASGGAFGDLIKILDAQSGHDATNSPLPTGAPGATA